MARSSATARAGRYLPQPTGYRAFIPNSLPPDPPPHFDDEMFDLLSRADRALGRLDGATTILPNPDLFVYMYVRKEAVLSSQIEGTQASLIDVITFEQQAADRGHTPDVQEVVNYVAAMGHGLERLVELPLSLRLIREIHGVLLSDVRGGQHDPGRFRRSQNWIGPPGCTLATARFVPPPPDEMTRALGELERYFHDPAPVPVLIKVGLAHAQFETIHPFLDGNGRVGRLLITFLLCEREVLRRPLLYLSYYFKRNQTEYYDRLQAVRDRGDWEGWLKFFLRGVFEVAQEATATAQRIVTMRETHRGLIAGRLRRRAAPGLDLLESLYERPIVTVGRVAEQLGMTFSTANELVKLLCEVGVLRPQSEQKRNRRFAYQEYLGLFSDTELQTPAVE